MVSKVRKVGRSLEEAVLHLFSSQKHMMPELPPSVMQTWSTMNRLMSISSVQVRLTDS